MEINPEVAKTNVVNIEMQEEDDAVLVIKDDSSQTNVVNIEMNQGEDATLVIKDDSTQTNVTDIEIKQVEDIVLVIKDDSSQTNVVNIEMNQGEDATLAIKDDSTQTNVTDIEIKQVEDIVLVIKDDSSQTNVVNIEMNQGEDATLAIKDDSTQTNVTDIEIKQVEDIVLVIKDDSSQTNVVNIEMNQGEDANLAIKDDSTQTNVTDIEIKQVEDIVLVIKDGSSQTNVANIEMDQEEDAVLAIKDDSSQTGFIDAVKDTPIAASSSLNEKTVEIQSNILLTSAIFDVKESNTNLENLIEHISSPVSTGLGLLAQYDSDSESEDAKELNTNSTAENLETKNYRVPDVVIASDVECDSDSDSDIECLNNIRKVIDKEFEIEKSDDDDDVHEGSASDKARNRQPPKVKGELLLDDLPPIQDLHITVPENECIELGRVHSIVDQLVLVNVLRNSTLLDLGTVLFLEKGQKVLGEIFDVLGQVSDPLYCIRFNSNNQIKEKEISVGNVVYVAPKTEYTQFLILSNLMKVRGSDASWENDIEPPPRYLDYSDDEEERDARTYNRNKDRPTSEDATKRSRPNLTANQPEPSNSQQHQNTSRPQYNDRHGSSQRSFQPNYNPNSWHSNFYQPYGGAAPPNYHIPPPPQHTHPMYFPHGQFNPYIQSMPPPQYQQAPRFNMNPYTVHPSAYPPPAEYPQQAPPGPN